MISVFNTEVFALAIKNGRLAGAALLLVGAVAAIAPRSPLQAGPAPEPRKSAPVVSAPSGSGSANTCDTDEIQHRPETTLEKYFSLYGAQEAQQPPSGKVKLAPNTKTPNVSKEQDPFHGNQADFLLATVPDPQTTNLALAFDRAVEGLIWAAGDADYRIEQYWIPWSANSESELSSLHDRECREKQLQVQYQQPGVLIFRKALDTHTDTDTVPQPVAPSFLVVFLVGESPSAGINLVAFARALSILPASTSTVRVVGPTFSGSLGPLAAFLNTALEQKAPRKFYFVSGSVTSQSAVAGFASALGSRCDCLPGDPAKIDANKTDAAVSLQFVVENDDRAGNLFFEFVRDRWSRHPFEAALLSEDDTAYGSVPDAIVTAEKNNDLLHHWLSLRYPRQIARLRNEATASSVGQDAKQQDSVLQATDPALRDESDATTTLHKETLPAFSKLQSPSSQQAALVSISSALKRERADYVGIIATDVLDALFLTRFVRLSFPDTRIFTFDSDLLFPKEEENTSFEGVLCITTYPLISRNQHWTVAQMRQGIPRRITFASRSAEGLYNAARYALQGSDQSYKASSKGELLLEYSRPALDGLPETHPPLWLTVLGRQGYWPIALLDEPRNKTKPASTLLDLDKSQALGPVEAIHPESPSGGWYLCTSVLLLFSVLHCIYVLDILTPRIADDPGVLRRIIDALKEVFRAHPSSVTNYEKPFLLIFTLVLFCGCFFLVLVMRPFENPSAPTQTVNIWFYGGAIGVVTFLFAIVCLLVIMSAVDRTAPAQRNFWLTIPSLLFAGLFCRAIVYLSEDPAYQQGLFFCYRSLNLTSGVSPTVPLLLLAVPYLIWSWKELRREKLSRQRREAVPSTAAAAGSREYYEKQVETAIEGILSQRVLRAAVVITVLWLLALAPWYSVRSLEWRIYDWLYWLTIALLFYMLSVSIVHLNVCWGEFRNFLQMLERSPVRRAFSRLRKQITWVPLVAKLPESQLLITTLSIETLQALKSFDLSNVPLQAAWDQLWSKIEPDATEAFRLKVICEDQISKTGDSEDDDYANLQCSLSNISVILANDLKATDWLKGVSESLQFESEKTDQEPLSEAQQMRVMKEEFIALRCVFFMRYVFRHLRNLLQFVVVAFIFILLSLESYPFKAPHWISFIFILTFVYVGFAVGVIFAQMDRDAILSRLTATRENELSKIFIFRMLQFGTLPLLTLLSTQFPWVHKAFASVIQPAIDALH